MRKLILVLMVTSASCASSKVATPPDGDSDDGTCVDVDGDTYGKNCEAGDDCDDDNVDHHAEVVGYPDSDADGFPADEPRVFCGVRDLGFLPEPSIDFDCNDNDDKTFPGGAPNDSTTLCLHDGDGDGYGDPNPTGAALAGSDCDDTDAALAVELVGYRDADGDGATIDENASFCALALPEGWRLVSSELSDCDDTDALTYPGAAPSDSAEACMRDADGDDFGDASTGEVFVPGSDCDDDAFLVASPQLYYADQDDDGFTLAEGEAFCLVSPPEGYLQSPNPDDCDDDDVLVFPGAATLEPGSDCMADRDFDGFGDANVTAPLVAGQDCDDDSVFTYPGAAFAEASLCTRDLDDDGYGDPDLLPPTDAGSDCDDGDPFRFETAQVYIDADGDGLGAGALVSRCFVAGLHQTGVSVVAGDTDDGDAFANDVSPTLPASTEFAGIYVDWADPICSDPEEGPGDGTPEFPACDIQEAIDFYTGSEEVIYVAEGTYTQNIVSPISIAGGYTRDASGLVWTPGGDASSTIIQTAALGSPVSFTGSETITLYNLTLSGGQQATLEVRDRDVFLKNCAIETGFSSSQIGPIGIKVRGNGRLVADNVTVVAHGSDSTGIEVRDGRLVAKNLVVEAGDDDSLSATGLRLAGGIATLEQVSVSIDNNVASVTGIAIDNSSALAMHDFTLDLSGGAATQTMVGIASRGFLDARRGWVSASTAQSITGVDLLVRGVALENVALFISDVTGEAVGVRAMTPRSEFRHFTLGIDVQGSATSLTTGGVGKSQIEWHNGIVDISAPPATSLFYRATEVNELVSEAGLWHADAGSCGVQYGSEGCDVSIDAWEACDWAGCSDLGLVVSQDPLLSPTGHLSAGSPAIDAGVALSPPVHDDFENNARPVGIAPDLGASETPE